MISVSLSIWHLVSFVDDHRSWKSGTSGAQARLVSNLLLTNLA